MALSRIWSLLFLVSFALALFKWLFRADDAIFESMALSMVSSAKAGFEISLGLTGVMTVWLGLMQIGERAGLIAAFARLLSPVMRRLFPSVPAGHPAMGAMVMNFSANMLGLDSAATPLGLQAMTELQTLNASEDTASDAQLMFTIINSAGLTLIPVSVMAIRAQQGAANPADIFIPAMLGTLVSATVAVLVVMWLQKIRFWQAALVLPLVAFLGLLGFGFVWLSHLGTAAISHYSQFAGSFLVVLVVMAFIAAGLWRKLNVYEVFIDGAKQGFDVAIKIIPYLVAMLLAIGFFRSSGALGYVLKAIELLAGYLGMDTAFVPALPTALMKPLSGSGARGLMMDTLTTYGPDSFVGKLVCTVQGSTETTFYILALYFGSVGLKNSRYALPVGLLIDAVGAVAAICIGYFFFR